METKISVMIMCEYFHLKSPTFYKRISSEAEIFSNWKFIHDKTYQKNVH